MEEPQPTQALATRAPMNAQTLALASRMGQLLYASGYFGDVRTAAQAAVKVQHGLELGLSPIAAMRGIFINSQNGQITYSASVIATLIQNSGRFTYRVQEWTDKVCKIAFFEHGESLGPPSVFSLDDAARAGLTNKPGPWKQYPKAMLFNRALTQGAKVYCNAVFNGVAPYTPEELSDGGADPETGGWDVESTATVVEDGPPPATADQKQAIQAWFRDHHMRGPDADKWLTEHNYPPVSQMSQEIAVYALTSMWDVDHPTPLAPETRASEPEPDPAPEPTEAVVPAA